MTFGEIIRKLLLEKNMTQRQLAAQLNIGASTLSNYVQNLREPDFATLKRLADYFDVSIDYLLDHRTRPAASHAEDDLLRVLRAMTAEQRELFVEQGKLFVARNKKREGP